MSDISRRTILGTGLLAVGAAGIGVGVGVATGSAARSTDEPQRSVGTAAAQNPVLLAAIDRESALLERLHRAVAANPGLAPSATVLQADHRAHRQALQALLLPTNAAASTSPAASSAATSSAAANSPAAKSGGAPSGALSCTADLRRWESAAAAAAAHDCATASTQLAPLLASISACEASHAAWLV